MRIEETIEIAAPPAIVWATTIDLARWPSWTPTVAAVELLDAGPVRVGLRARVTQPGNRPAIWTVTRVDAGQAFAWETRALGMRVSAFHGIDATATGSRATLAIEIAGATAALFGWIVARVSRRFLPQEAAGLKHECERIHAGRVSSRDAAPLAGAEPDPDPDAHPRSHP